MRSTPQAVALADAVAQMLTASAPALKFAMAAHGVKRLLVTVKETSRGVYIYSWSHGHVREDGVTL